MQSTSNFALFFPPELYLHNFNIIMEIYIFILYYCSIRPFQLIVTHQHLQLIIWCRLNRRICINWGWYTINNDNNNNNILRLCIDCLISWHRNMYKPVWKTCVALLAPTIQGRPYSLATTAPWLIRPPNSVTIPPNNGKYGLQPMSVQCVIKISPCCIFVASDRSVITHALPSTEPLQIEVPSIFVHPS